MTWIDLVKRDIDYYLRLHKFIDVTVKVQEPGPDAVRSLTNFYVKAKKEGQTYSGNLYINEDRTESIELEMTPHWKSVRVILPGPWSDKKSTELKGLLEEMKVHYLRSGLDTDKMLGTLEVWLQEENCPKCGGKKKFTAYRGEPSQGTEEIPCDYCS